MYPPDSHRQIFKGLLFAGGFCVASYWIFSTVHGFYIQYQYAQRRERKRLEKNKAKKAFEEYLRQNSMSDEEIERITSTSMAELIQLLKAKELTPERVLLAFQHKAFELDKRCNCVVEFLYPDLSEINLNGPFAGLPISVKEGYSIKGCESYAGMARYLTGPAAQDCVLVTVFKSLGLVPFVRSGVPQALLSVLSSNPIDGTVLNPLDPTRSPAGSSSGEAALVGGGASVLGFGTDLGGSIRLPAAMCNCVGFKPTPDRLSLRLMFTTNRFMTTSSCAGPLTRDVDSCITILKALFDSSLHHELDYFNAPLTYSLEVPTDRPLRIGYFVHDGCALPVPAAQRAVSFVKERLATLGHELVPWQPPYKGTEWLEMFLTALLTDGGVPLCDALRHDKVEPGLKIGLRFYEAWWITRYFNRFMARLLGKTTDLCLINACCAVYDIPSLMTHFRELKCFRQRIYDDWNKHKLDAVISPAFGMAAPIPVQTTKKFTEMLTYLNLYNITNMPAGCIPSGIRVSAQDLERLETDTSSWSKAVKELQKDTLGFPVSIQVAAAPWRDEMCLHVMKQVEEAIKTNVDG